jgi:hypothetical protein
MTRKRQRVAVPSTAGIFSDAQPTKTEGAASAAKSPSQSVGQQSSLSSLPASAGVVSDSVSAAAVPYAGGSGVIQPLSEQFPASKRLRRSSRHACEFSKLADVENQLILHWLTNTERLVAARVSRRMRQLISQPFSWTHAEMLRFEFSDELPALLQTSLLRMAPIHLTIPVFPCSRVVPEHIAAVPRLHSLLNTNFLFGCEENVLTLLELPGAQNLKRLNLAWNFATRAELQLIARLPMLQHLQLSCDLASDELACLSQAPSLTALRISECRIVGLAPLSRCRLQRLIVGNHTQQFMPGTFASLFSGSLAVSLLQLCLSFSSASTGEEPSVSAEEYATAFRALVQLRALSVNNVHKVNVMLSQIIHLLSLESLCVCVEHTLSLPVPDSVPSAAALNSLASASPALFITVLLGGRISAENVEPLRCVGGIRLIIDVNRDTALFDSEMITLGERLPATNVS